MSSQMKYTPDPYSHRQNQIITNSTPYNGRVNLEEPENPDAYNPYVLIQKKNT